MAATGQTNAKLYEQFEAEERAALWLRASARGDEAEAERLKGTCPRKTYTQPDAAFQDRLATAFDILAVVCIDLRCLWSKISTLDWVAGEVKELATLHHITADLAFVEGTNCARGLPQCRFFRKPPRDFEAEAAAAIGDPARPKGGVDDDDNSDSDDDAAAGGACEREPGRAEPGDDDDDGDEEDDGAGSGGAGDAAMRMEAVERRSEHNSALTMFVISQVSLAAGKQLLDVWTAFDRFCRSRLKVDAATALAAWGVPVADDFERTLKRLDFLKPDEERVEEYLGLICTPWDRKFDEAGEED